MSWIPKFLSAVREVQQYSRVYASCFQFSGLKQAASYVEGSGGKDAKSKMLHYEKFFGPQNISRMSGQQRAKILNSGMSDIKPLGGSDFFYLCLNDINISYSQSSRNSLTSGEDSDGISNPQVSFSADHVFRQ